jgi:hypothetical protein
MLSHISSSLCSAHTPSHNIPLGHHLDVMQASTVPLLKCMSMWENLQLSANRAKHTKKKHDVGDRLLAQLFDNLIYSVSGSDIARKRMKKELQ